MYIKYIYTIQYIYKYINVYIHIHVFIFIKYIYGKVLLANIIVSNNSYAGMNVYML